MRGDEVLEQAIARAVERLVREHLAGCELASFEPCALGHLNRVATGPDEAPAYMATEPDDDQRDLLARLRLGHLVDEAEIATRIQPRPAA